jgi:hypothetical protein
VSCEGCEEIREKDGIAPDCETDKGCVIPPIDVTERRILEIRDKLVALQGLVDSGDVLKMYGATRRDIELLVMVEKELKENTPRGNDG